MRKSLQEYSDKPTYNMKAVEQQTGISAATLRAWERRYNLVVPQRTNSGYRLYSERDIALLHWVRQQMAEGLTISRVVAMLHSAENSGNGNGSHSYNITVDMAEQPAWVRESDTPHPAEDLVDPLVMALVQLDEGRADRLLEKAFSLYTLQSVYMDILTPAMTEIGNLWHRGDILITTEHYATAYIRGRLLQILHSFPRAYEKPPIIAGCAPGEQHDIGSILFTLTLRQRGFNVIYLGADVPLEDLMVMAEREKPVIICLSASIESSAIQLQNFQSMVSQLEDPPVFIYGGRAFDQDPHLRARIPGLYLGPDVRMFINRIEEILNEN